MGIRFGVSVWVPFIELMTFIGIDLAKVGPLYSSSAKYLNFVSFQP
jgi:hypothetical protein